MCPCNFSVEANQDLSRWSCGLTTWQRAAFVFWAPFQHETLPRVSGLTQGRPCLYLFTTRSLFLPCTHVFLRLPAPLSTGQTAAQIIATSRKHDYRTARPLHTSTVEHGPKSGSDIFWTWSSRRRLSGSDLFTATGTGGNIQTGAEPKHISPW